MSIIKVALNTNQGKIVLELDDEKAPESVKNFTSYVESGHYEDTIFHRVIDGFMIQGGGFDIEMNQKPTQAPVKNEANNGLKNQIGTIAMARTSDPHSATAQFFINTVDNGFLDHTAESAQGWGYTVFGEVCTGIEIVNKIVKVKVGTTGAHKDVPEEPVIIESAAIVE
ncbi:MAG: peptidyl-prolyl cis-trans isomerase [Pseudomonadales bacterium]|nr:peptidyl-prolyl cis-trans isomerase [Pseudomonadales bacterium]